MSAVVMDVAAGPGALPQRFCSEPCRRASERAIREWAQGELAAGRATIAEIKRER